MGSVRAWALVATAGVGLLAGCGSSDDGAPPLRKDELRPVKRIARPVHAWILYRADQDLPAKAYLSNGTVGLRFDPVFGLRREPADGPELLDARRYDREGEEKIAPSMSPFTPYLEWASNPVADGPIQLQQWLDMRTGTVHARWMSAAGPVETETRFDLGRPVLAHRIRLSSAPAGEYVATFDAGPSGSGSEGDLAEYCRKNRIVPADEVGVRAAVRLGSESARGREAATITLARAGRLEATFAMGFDADPGDAADVWRRAESGWGGFWDTDIEIEGPVEDQQAIRSLLFYLRTSVATQGTAPVGPFGLSNHRYNGHAFWDADLWVFPALALLDPDRARRIPEYRLRMADAARENFRLAKSWHDPPSKALPTGGDVLQYPWESSVGGLETGLTETRQQHHITGSVVFGLSLADALGLADPDEVKEVGRAAARFYAWRRDRAASGEWTLKRTVSPDEFHFGDDDLYTNCIAEWTMRTFLEPKTRFFRPRDATSFLNYSGDPGKGYKQAAGALAIYPLQDPLVEPEAEAMMERFAGKASWYGPAMTESLHALVWARLGQPERGYAVWRKELEEFGGYPLGLFSENRGQDETYFLTGAAGSLQAVLYGFCGLRIDDGTRSGAAWSVPLRNGKALSIRPRLPKAWRSVRIRGLTVLGKRYDVTLRGEDVQVRPIL